MSEATWHAARLIPTSGINGAQEQERRATSALLAVMHSVKEFGRAILSPLGAPAGKVEAFIEVPFQLGDRRVIPDGLVRVSRGSKVWVALVEVKTGSNQLEAPQLEDYLDVAREQGFDAVLTISNEMLLMGGAHPTVVDKRKLRKVALHHLSWTQVLTRAVVQKDHQGVSDPDQAWILGELIRYLEHPRSGAMEFESMGSSWVAVRDAVQARTLRPTDKGAAEVAGRWDQLISYAGLRLGRQLGVDVSPTLSRKELADPASRASALLARLQSEGVLEGGLRIPNAVGPIGVLADIRSSTVTVFTDIEAPREGRPTTRVNWLVRQLKDAPDSLRIDCFAFHARTSTSELLKTVRENPAILVADPKRDIRSFRVAQSAPMGAKAGKGRGGFITSVLDLLDGFYRSTVQNVKPWAAAPPKLRPDVTGDQPEVPPALVSTSLSSQDGAETAPRLANRASSTESVTPESASAATGTTSDGSGVDLPIDQDAQGGPVAPSSDHLQS